MKFSDPDGSGEQSMALSKRYLYGEVVDQILAQEDVTKSISATDRVVWPLVDNLGTVRDLAKQDGSIASHYTYDSYGKVASGDTSLTRYLFTSREWDTATELQSNRARWYDPAVGRWLSEDPIGFVAGDANVQRYVGNHGVNALDSSGLLERPEDDHDIDEVTPARWRNAYPRPPLLIPHFPSYAPSVPAYRPPLDDFGLPTGLGQWSLSDFFAHSYLNPSETRFGCGGLFALRAGIPNTNGKANPQLVAKMPNVMVFKDLGDAVAYLNSPKLNGNGLIGGVQSWQPWTLRGSQEIPDHYMGPVTNVDLGPAHNWNTLQGTKNDWYWETGTDSWANGGFPLHHKGSLKTPSSEDFPNGQFPLYLVIPNTPSRSPIPMGLLPTNE